MEELKKEYAITYDEYNKIKSKIDSCIEVEELINAHSYLIGKDCEYYNDCGAEFIESFLNRDWGRSIVYQYNDGAKKFINSKYLSDYFLNSIKKLTSDVELSNKIDSYLENNKVINELNDGEIKELHSAIKEAYRGIRDDKISNVACCFMPYIYKLNGEGILSYIRNNIANNELASNILLTSGLVDRASYYSGRGVNYSDLNENNLVSIFNKLYKIDKNYGINFIKLVNKMKTLGATEFINMFLKFSNNNFDVEGLEINNSNVSLDGLYGNAMNLVATVSAFSVMYERNEDYQISASNDIKSAFISKIKRNSLNGNFSNVDDDNIYYEYPYMRRNIRR